MNRSGRFASLLEERGCDAALIHRRQNIRYLTGFTGEGCLFVARDFCAVMTDFRYTEQLSYQAPQCLCVRTHAGKSDAQLLEELCRRAKADVLGVETDFISYDEYVALVDALPDVSIKPLAKLPEEMRAIKDADEFASMEKAAAIACRAEDAGAAVVLGTTGYARDQLRRIAQAAERIPVVHSSNYSLGVAVLRRAVSLVAPVLLANGFDAEIIETHHNQKADAPSGTAKALLNAIDPEENYERVYGRVGVPGARGHEIGIHAVRGGTVAGEHSVLFFGQDELIELRHSAASRRIFAAGAVKALQFAVGRKPGLYSIDDVLGL